MPPSSIQALIIYFITFLYPHVRKETGGRARSIHLCKQIPLPRQRRQLQSMFRSIQFLKLVQEQLYEEAYSLGMKSSAVVIQSYKLILTQSPSESSASLLKKTNLSVRCI